MAQIMNNTQKCDDLDLGNLKEETFDFSNFQELRNIISSESRSKILLSLYLHRYDLNNVESLKNEVKKPSPYILNSVKQLEILGLIKRANKIFYLTSKGTIITIIFLKLIENIYIFKKNDFWTVHNLKQIPHEFLNHIYFLKDGKYVCSIANDLTIPIREYLKLIKSSKDLNIVIPIFSKTHLDEIFKSTIESKGNLKMVASKEIFNLIFNSYQEKIDFLIKKNKIELWMVNNFDLEIFLTNSSDFSLLSLFFRDGHYDNANLLLDKSTKGIEWGLKLFNYYKDKGTIIQLDKVL
ncbi:MAG: DUF1724 domain-containing protein [Methanobrevibacter sp.]|jgi:predicted transcriptional regulator|nr:DUF1724 domain-containing protein [Candidatus Methanovirga basalitermitum]